MTSVENAIETLSLAPFVQVEGVVNIRTIGGFPTSSDPSKTIRTGAIFRSGDVSHITEKGKKQLRELGVRRVFDFRADTEIASYKSANPTVEGVEFIRTPVSQEESFDPVSLTSKMQAFHKSPTETFLQLYEEILEAAGPAYETVFRRLINEPGERCLIHCTAGKDRTGLFIALLLLLLDARDEDIVNDYALTAVGLAPALPIFAAKFKEIPAYRDNWEGFMAMSSSKPETMTAALDMIRKKYGGAEGYLKAKTNLSEEDFETLRERFIISVA